MATLRLSPPELPFPGDRTLARGVEEPELQNGPAFPQLNLVAISEQHRFLDPLSSHIGSVETAQVLYPTSPSRGAQKRSAYLRPEGPERIETKPHIFVSSGYDPLRRQGHTPAGYETGENGELGRSGDGSAIPLVVL